MDRTSVFRTAGVAVAVALLAAPAAAHGGALGGTLQPVPVPFWLVVVTGGGVVAASFLFASFATDHGTIRSVNAWGPELPARESVRAWATRALGAVSVAVLLLVVASGLVGPQSPTASFAVLVVWVGWWAGYPMTVYGLGDSWPALDPWRTIASVLPDLDREYPERLGAWPSVAGLLALVWLEVVSPVAEQPRLLAVVVAGYSIVTIAGAVAFGTDAWFRTVDPVARVFRFYGKMAPVQRTDDGLELGLPGAALARADEPLSADDVAFVVALLWATTFDGLVSTPTWASVAGPVVEAGVPPLALYLATIAGGFVGFLGVYRLASRLARRTGSTYVSAAFVRGWFAPSLIPIAAGYHVAHFLGYFLGLLPALLGVLAHPFSVPALADTLAMPGWFGGLQLGFVLVGHLVAIWVAHALSFEVFAGRLQPIRSQYPFIAVMIFYTMTSMWVVAQPFSAPPYV